MALGESDPTDMSVVATAGATARRATEDGPSRRHFLAAAAAGLVLGVRELPAQGSGRRARRKAAAPVSDVAASLATVATPPDSQLTIWRDRVV